MLSTKSYEIILAEVPLRELHAPSADIDPETGEYVPFLTSVTDIAEKMGGRTVLSMNGKQSGSAHEHNSGLPMGSQDRVITIVGQFPMTPTGFSALQAIKLHDALIDRDSREFVAPPQPGQELYQAYLES